jgi:hypothetical protein
MGAAVLSRVCLTTPVGTIDTTTHRTVQMAREPRMPMGKSRRGLRVSSAVVTMTALKRELSLTPTIATAVRTRTTAPAVRSTGPSAEIDSGMGNTEETYLAQPTDTAAAPRVTRPPGPSR